MKIDGNLVFLILVFAAVFTAAQAAVGLLSVATQKRRVNKRLKIAEAVDGVSALVTELRKQRGLNAAGDKGDGRLRWLSDLIVASGVTYEPKKWAAYALLAAILGGVGLAALTHNPVMFVLGALVVGLGGPIMWLKTMAGKRAKALGFQLPQALEIIVRSLEAGHPVPTAVALVGREMPDPVGSEFGMVSDEIAYGATLEQAIARMAERCQHADVDLFAATVRLQAGTGGNLTGLLKLNASTVRERHKMRLKIKAASSEGRASAMILTSAPFIAIGFICISSPHFYGDVIHEPVVKIGLAGLGTWMFIGNMVMRRMIDMRL
ncbi:MAG TPA: type II secretion system F family protein [Phenylobacterium sp.]|nr:type II secretion system F family protein [Phenylobacterium sp.]